MPEWVKSDEAAETYRRVLRLLVDDFAVDAEEQAWQVLVTAYRRAPQNRELLDLLGTLVLTFFDAYTGYYERAAAILEEYLHAHPADMSTMKTAVALYWSALPPTKAALERAPAPPSSGKKPFCARSPQSATWMR